MSSQTRSGGIPFPLASEQGGSTSSKANRGAQQSTMGQETFATPEVPVRRGARPSSQDGPSDDGANGASGPAIRRGHKTSNSSSSSGSTAGTEGLPSIRNLLSSIHSDEHAPSPTSMSRRPLPSSSQGSEGHLANRLQAFGQGGRGPFRPPEQQGTSSHWRNSQSWDLKSSVRPSSPTRRPPLAPSAYAHAHFSPSGSRAGLFGAATSREDGAQHGKNSRSRASHLSLHSNDYGRAQQVPDAQPAGRSREDDRSSGTGATDMDEDGQGYEGERDSAAVRRRHTLGALDEPPRLRADGAEVSLAEDKDMATTPRAPYHHKLLSPIHRIPESPTTPTASNVAVRTNQPEGHRPQHSRSGSDMALPPNAHPLYMQGGMHVSGSMPSLVSHTASPLKPGARKSSFEDGREGGPAWSGHGTYNGSETLTSPHSSVWHSRSSTLDSIDTASSLGMRSGSSMAALRGGSHMHSHHHSLSSSSVSSMGMRRPPVEEFPRTPTHARHDYNRNWRFPANQGTPREGLPPPGMVGEGGTPTGPGVHASPFANMSLSSPSDPRTNAPPYYPRQHPYDSPQHRPRAQTLSYNDRPIAPLPSHAVHGSPHHSPAYHAPTRSLSSHSVSSLPQRVSSMQLEHWNSPSVVDFQSPSSVAGRSPTGTVIVSAKAGAGSGSSTNKYTCTWCGKRFSRPSSLKIHYHSHTGEKPYTCDEPGCGRNFSVQSNLRRHQKSHATFSERIGDEGELRRSGSLHSRHASDASHSTASFGSQRRHSGTLGQPWGSPISSSRSRAPFLAAQNRRPSISSTTAGEDEEEEEYELEEEEAARSLGSLKTRRFEYAPGDKGAPARYEPRHETGSSDGAAADDADETMQDIRHEKEAPAQSAA